MASYGYTFNSGDGVTPTRLNAARTVSDIVNADIKSDAAIAGTKIAPNFGSQNVVTTGTISSGAITAPTLTLNTGSTPLLISNASEPYVEVRDTTATTRAFMQASNGIGGIGTISNHPFRINTNNTERLRIDASGNVGIGTSSPSAKTEISTAAAAASALKITDATNYTLTAGYSASGVGYFGGDVGSALALTSNGSERIRIDASGNVGIGAASGGAPLQISKTSEVSQGTIHVRPPSGSNTSITFTESGVADRGSIGFQAGSGTLEIKTSGHLTSGTTRMSIKASGQVRFVPLASDPAGAEAGDVYYNSTSNKLRVYNGTSWLDLH